jgi:hypothetical protein
MPAVDDAAVTVNNVLPEIAPEVAVILAAPVATLVAKPLEITVATPVLDELHVTDSVMF